jgi:hypothetical protein
MITDMKDTASKRSIASAGSRAWRAIIAGGLAAGAFDITYAFIAWGLLGMSPIRIGQSVASGLLGKEAAVSGGVATGILGLFLHFSIAVVMAAVYYAAATRVPLLVKRAVVCGIAYGLVLYAVMNFVVMPLSAIGAHGGGGPLYIPISGILVHMFLVGLPIALFTRRALRSA